MQKYKSESEEDFRRARDAALLAASAESYDVPLYKHDPESESKWSDLADRSNPLDVLPDGGWRGRFDPVPMEISVRIDLQTFKGVPDECARFLKNWMPPEQIEEWYCQKLIDRNFSPETFDLILPTLRAAIKAVELARVAHPKKKTRVWRAAA
jgi:hypothetical protein